MLGPISSRIEHYMDLLSARQKLVVSNIANADTPDYHTKDIDFHFEFMSQITAGEATSGSGEKALPPNVIEPSGLIVKNDGNDVSLDREMRLLAETSIRFQAASAFQRAQIKMMRSAIQEGRG